MKKSIKIDEELVRLRGLADEAFYQWRELDREYPFVSYKEWTKAWKRFEEAREQLFNYRSKGLLNG